MIAAEQSVPLELEREASIAPHTGLDLGFSEIANNILPPPFELVRSRLAMGDYVPGSCSDKHRLVGVIDSGGVAGINALAKLWGLMPTGLLSVFDELQGDSIGGIIAAAAVADQIRETLDVFYSLGENRFIDGWRAIRVGKQVVDMHFLTDAVSQTLDIDRVSASPIPVIIGVTKLKPFSHMAIDLTKVEKKDIVPWLMRGAHLPIVSGAAPRDESGTPYADGALSGRGPLIRAIEGGATEAIYLKCQPERRNENGEKIDDTKQLLQVAAIGAWASRHDPLAILKLNRTINQQLADRRHFKDGDFQFQGANVYGIYPPVQVSLFETRRPVLEDSFSATLAHMQQRLSFLLPNIQPAVA